jgi:hypothetical protein
MFAKLFKRNKNKKYISGMIVKGSPIITKAINVSDQEIMEFKKLLVSDYNKRSLKDVKR